MGRMNKKGFLVIFVIPLICGFIRPVWGQIPGFTFLENPTFRQPTIAIEHWSEVDALSASFTSPMFDQMSVRVNATEIHSTLKTQFLWGHSIPWGEQDSLVLAGGVRRQRFSAYEAPLWSLVWRIESRISTGLNALHPFVEWSSALRSSNEQSTSNLRFGAMFFRQFPQAEMQILCQWIEPSWTFDIKFFWQFYEWLSVGLTGQFEPRIWGLNCRLSLDRLTAQFGLAPVPSGGWRSRWAFVRGDLFGR